MTKWTTTTRDDAGAVQRMINNLAFKANKAERELKECRLRNAELVGRIKELEMQLSIAEDNAQHPGAGI